MNEIICPNCHKSSYKEVKENGKIKVREDFIFYEDIFNKCLNCDYEFDSINNPDVLGDVVYPKYRKLKNMISPEKYKEFKEIYNLSNLEISELLNESVKYIKFFERGNLQELKFDQKLKDLFKAKGYNESI